jgi:hypothetical protein
MQRLLRIFIMQQQVPAINIVIAKLKNPKSSELTTKAIPAVIINTAKRR